MGKLDFSKPGLLQTRDGREVRIYATDGKGKYPIHGAILTDGGWEDQTWTHDGCLLTEHSAEAEDLIAKPQRVTGWMNVYKSNNNYTLSDIYESKDRVKNLSSEDCLGQIYIDTEVQS